MFNRNFWLGDNGALVRAVRTFGQTAAAMLTVSTFSPFDAGSWWNTFVISGTAAMVSLLMSLDRRESLLAPAPQQQEQPVFLLPKPAVKVEEPDFDPNFVGCGESLR